MSERKDNRVTDEDFAGKAKQVFDESVMRLGIVGVTRLHFDNAALRTDLRDSFRWTYSVNWSSAEKLSRRMPRPHSSRPVSSVEMNIIGRDTSRTQRSIVR